MTIVPPPGPVTAHRAPSQQPPIRSLRAWLAALCVMALMAAYAIGWFGYSFTRTSSIYYQTGPGQVVDEKGTLYRLDSLTATTTLASKFDPIVAADGEVFIVALVTAQTDADYGADCYMELLAVDGRTWDPESSVSSRPFDRACYDVKKGQTKQFELIYRVPASAVPKLAGLAFKGMLSLNRTGVLTPAA